VDLSVGSGILPVREDSIGSRFESCGGARGGLPIRGRVRRGLGMKGEREVGGGLLAGDRWDETDGISRSRGSMTTNPRNGRGQQTYFWPSTQRMGGTMCWSLGFGFRKKWKHY
jgi:hypothetical protein